MTLSTFPTFLTFLTQALCFPVPASDPWQGLETPSYPSPRAPWAAGRRAEYDETGLIWLLQGRPVVALTEATAAIQSATGAITTYRRHNKPAPGVSPDDFAP